MQESKTETIVTDADGKLVFTSPLASGFPFGPETKLPLTWSASVQPGVYEVHVQYVAPDSAPTFRLQTQDGRFVQDRLPKKGEMRSGADGQPQNQSLGPLAFSKNETVKLDFQRVDTNPTDVVNLETVTLNRIGGTENSVLHPQVKISEVHRINPKDGAEMIWVPEGKFIMGGLDGKDQNAVYLSGYWIYKLPVTVQQFRQFCTDTKREMPRPPGWGWIDNHPMVNVSWYESLAYAKWANVRLPSEAEWEKAARGTDGRVLPWGNDFDTARLQSPRDLHGFQGTTPVGYFPAGASPYGALDMAGNVWQWCTSRIAPYPYVANDGREDTDNWFEGERRTYRGGGFVMNSWRMDWTILHRGNYFPIETDKNGKTIALRRDHIGFRCASSEGSPADSR